MEGKIATDTIGELFWEGAAVGSAAGVGWAASFGRLAFISAKAKQNISLKNEQVDNCSYQNGCQNWKNAHACLSCR
jgi:hypothetical protein